MSQTGQPPDEENAEIGFVYCIMYLHVPYFVLIWVLSSFVFTTVKLVMFACSKYCVFFHFLFYACFN